MKIFFLLDTGKRIDGQMVPSYLNDGLPVGCIDIESAHSARLCTCDPNDGSRVRTLSIEIECVPEHPEHFGYSEIFRNFNKMEYTEQSFLVQEGIYIYRGNSIKRAAIAKLSGLSFTTVSKRIKCAGAVPGGDVTGIIDIPKNHGGRRAGSGRVGGWPDGLSPRSTPERFRRLGNALVEHVNTINDLAVVLAHYPELESQVLEISQRKI